MHPKAFEISLCGFPTLFKPVISLFSNSDNLVPLAIYVFSIINITVLIDFILSRLYTINFSIKLSPFSLVLFLEVLYLCQRFFFNLA